ncbi:hypothetical protein [uncultured Reyranella sp.]|nr:hypothetical protein [uncultured Reyranella sp.]
MIRNIYTQIVVRNQMLRIASTPPPATDAGDNVALFLARRPP